MKKYFTLTFFFAAYTASAQVPPGCLSDMMRERLFGGNPAIRLRHESMEQQILQQLTSPFPRLTTQYTIPVVVHIIHNNGTENISDTRVIQGINDLNEAFSNTGAYHRENGVKTTIRFCLAVQDENGNFTTGINRVISPLTNLTAETQDVGLKNLIRWDPEKYLNIWLVNEITSVAMGSGVAGYAYFPSSHGNPEDGIVNEARFFGSSTDNSKIHVHEAGHYLGLYHTFEGGCTNANCLTNGDRVCDTPPDNSSGTANCTSPPNSCTSDDADHSENNPFRPVNLGGQGDQPDPVDNYMDYGFPYCQVRFSQGQAERMVTALTSARASLLHSRGCQTICTSPITAGFTMSADTITSGETVHFNNTSSGATSYEWTVNNISFATNLNSSYTFTTPGYYSIRLVASNNDIACDKSWLDTVIVKCGAQASFSVSPDAPYDRGANILFTNTSTNASGYRWFLDGVEQAAGTDFNQVFENQGGHSVYLVAGNGMCNDTSQSYFFQVGQCDVSKMTWNWHITGNEISFSSGVPIVSANTAIEYTECTSGISDQNGNLLFFSDGVKVWDRRDSIMPNGSGLMGHVSSAQGVLITPDPGHAQRFYVFTVDAAENNYRNGLRYSIVDMRLNNGLGDVTATKNVAVVTGVREILTATWHSNGRDIWIATHEAEGNGFYAFLLTDSGLTSTPVVSNIGPPSAGRMRFSHDGNRVATSIPNGLSNSDLVIADFNKTSGAFSNPLELSLSGLSGYGIEFSPDNSKLYVSTILGFVSNRDRVYQFNLAAGSPTEIINSRIGIDTYSGTHIFGHLRLAPDGRIYVAVWNSSTHLDVIKYPNLQGMACAYTQKELRLGLPRNSFDLPNMLAGLLQERTLKITGPDRLCEGKRYSYLLENSLPGDSITWSSRGAEIVSSNGYHGASFLPSAVNESDSIFVTLHGPCGITYDTMLIHVSPKLQPDLGKDTTLCTGNILLTPGEFSFYEWQDGSTLNSFITDIPGTYSVSVSNDSICFYDDTITISGPPVLPVPDLGNDTSVCQGKVLVLDAGNGYHSYTWQDGSHNERFTAFLSGTYWVTVSGDCFSASDTIRIFNNAALEVDLGADTVYCERIKYIILRATPGYEGYVWQDGSTADSLLITEPGTYWVNVNDGEGCFARDTIEVAECPLAAGREPKPARFIFYPNPADEYVTILHDEKEYIQLFLFDAAGRRIKPALRSGSIKGYTTFGTNELNEGFYILEVRNGPESHYSKLLIRHR